MSDLLSIDDLGPAGIENVLELSDSFVEVTRREIPKVPALRGKTVVTLFYEDSTRTRLSFETAAKRLSADTMSFTAGTSSVTKGESLLDTVVAVVDLPQAHPHVLGGLGREVLAHEVGADRELAVPSVHEDRELDGARPSELVQGLERRSYRPPGEQDVVDEDHDPAGDVHRDLGRAEGLHPPQPDVVAVEGDVDRPDRDRLALETLDRLRQPAGDGDTTRVEPDEDEVAGAVVPLHDLVRDASLRAAQVLGVEDLRPQHKKAAPVGGRVRNLVVLVVGAGGAVIAGHGRAHVVLRGDLAGSPSRFSRG